MAITRETGAVQPGFKWGPFTARVPFYHTRMEWPEFAQGIFVAGATGLGLVPVLMNYFGLGFEQALACVFIQSILLSSAPLLFGDPYAHGWITPALPLALTFVLAADAAGNPIYATSAEKFQVMTAVSLQFAALTAVLGVTGLGAWLMRNIPAALKGGIILGAAIAALKRVFIDDADRFLNVQPITTIAAISICLIITFSLPLQKWRAKFPLVKFIASLGLLPGFMIAAIVGPLAGEVVFAPDTSRLFLIPPFYETFMLVSPFGIGWPPMALLLDPNLWALAIMGYVIWFGDVVTGTEILDTAKAARPDEKIDLNFSRSHLSAAIRNALMAVLAPFFPTQGSLWTGVQVIIVQRWAEGRKGMDSLFGGIASYYVFGIPVLYLVLPLVTALQPLMGVALSLTLVLTGFACAYVAMSVTHNPIERGVALLTAVSLALYAENPWIGMAIGIVATFTLIGIQQPAPPKAAGTA
jgi:hypothetical protein